MLQAAESARVSRLTMRRDSGEGPCHLVEAVEQLRSVHRISFAPELGKELSEVLTGDTVTLRDCDRAAVIRKEHGLTSEIYSARGTDNAVHLPGMLVCRCHGIHGPASTFSCGSINSSQLPAHPVEFVERVECVRPSRKGAFHDLPIIEVPDDGIGTAA
ncbi:hypothetical protein [Streptomyces capitiformicae]|uniref:hypothetical protein n=1 Tax=Streptomyces capitiformicae TaxID=2014920 RepID=UPI001E2C685E|nr:hypothetical protein [Streptomyces capitiformicae]